MDVVYATTATQVVTPDGGRHTVLYGQHWHSRHPVVLAAPAGLFSPDPQYGLMGGIPPEVDEPPVEQATAAPGERRNARRG